MTKPESYQPKGGQCANCAKLKNNCSHLDFEKMRVIQQDFYADKTVFIVLCSKFERKINPQFRRKVTIHGGNCMAYERDGQHFIGDKSGSKRRRLPVGKSKAHRIADQTDSAFAADVKARLDFAALTGNKELING